MLEKRSDLQLNSLVHFDRAVSRSKHKSVVVVHYEVVFLQVASSGKIKRAAGINDPATFYRSSFFTHWCHRLTHGCVPRSPIDGSASGLLLLLIR